MNQTPPWVTTPEQDAAIEAAKARLAAERPTDEPASCEDPEHVPGQCVEECVTLLNMMMGDDYDDTPYDPTGCRRPKPMPTGHYVLDAERGAILFRNVHPEDCECGKPACPRVIEDEAFWSVVGEERRAERWISTDMRTWTRDHAMEQWDEENR